MASNTTWELFTKGAICIKLNDDKPKAIKAEVFKAVCDAGLSEGTATGYVSKMGSVAKFLDQDLTPVEGETFDDIAARIMPAVREFWGSINSIKASGPTKAAAPAEKTETAKADATGPAQGADVVVISFLDQVKAWIVADTTSDEMLAEVLRAASDETVSRAKAAASAEVIETEAIAA
jgi:hypothetical protein